MVNAWTALLDEKGLTPFRRSDLAERLYPLTRPRSRESAEAAADKIIKAAAGRGEISRFGHLHWKLVEKTRTLHSGRAVEQTDALISLNHNTRCPAKWATVDMETGEVYVGNVNGWKKAPPELVDELRALLDHHVANQ